jgi:hypothetical protein
VLPKGLKIDNQIRVDRLKIRLKAIRVLKQEKHSFKNITTKESITTTT